MLSTIITRVVGVLGVLGLYASFVVMQEAYYALIAKGNDKRWALLLVILTFFCSACILHASELFF